MNEYGVLLADDIVAPTASLVEAVVYSRGADREVCARKIPDGEWSIVEPARYRNLRVDCLAPGSAGLRRHAAAGEPACGACLAWERAYRRNLRRRQRETS